jgi:hypothetical protein
MLIGCHGRQVIDVILLCRNKMSALTPAGLLNAIKSNNCLLLGYAHHIIIPATCKGFFSIANLAKMGK